MPGESATKLSVVDFLKLLVLLYAALVPAGLWVKGEIKSAISDAVTNGQLVSLKELDAREEILRRDLNADWAEGLGPVVSYIASVESRLAQIAKTASTPPPPIIVRERDGKRERTWEWPNPKGKH